MNAHAPPADYHPSVFTSGNACDAISRRIIRAMPVAATELHWRLYQVLEPCVHTLAMRGKMPVDMIAMAVRNCERIFRDEPSVHHTAEVVRDRVRRRYALDARLLGTYRTDEICSEIVGTRALIERDRFRIKLVYPRIYLRAHAVGRHMLRTRQPPEALLAQMHAIAEIAHFLAIPLSRDPARRIAIALDEGLLHGTVTPGTDPIGYGYVFKDQRGAQMHDRQVAYGSRMSGTDEIPEIEFTTFLALDDLGPRDRALHAQMLAHQARIAPSARALFASELLEAPWTEDPGTRRRIRADWEAAADLLGSPQWRQHVARRDTLDRLPDTRRADSHRARRLPIERREDRPFAFHAGRDFVGEMREADFSVYAYADARRA